MIANPFSADDRKRLVSYRLWIIATVFLGLAAGVAIRWL
jgi:hypothetical protein